MFLSCCVSFCLSCLLALSPPPPPPLSQSRRVQTLSPETRRKSRAGTQGLLGCIGFFWGGVVLIRVVRVMRVGWVIRVNTVLGYEGN